MVTEVVVMNHGPVRAIEAYVPSVWVGLATLLGALAVLLSLGLFAKWLRRPMGQRLKPIIAQRDEIAILMHPDPDPDSMACAMGLAHLASIVGTKATIQYTGQIRHQENRVFRNVLDIDMEHIQRIDELASEDVILVDHNKPRGIEGAGQLMPFAVIDHHPGDGTGLDFTDTRDTYGACASIIAEYLQDIGATPVPPEDVDETDNGFRFDDPKNPCVSPRLATGLLYGIHSDTNKLTSGCIEADFQAAAYLCRGVDEELLDRIANPQVDTEVLDVKNRAFSNRTEQGSFIVSNVGPVNNSDAIPQAADELLSLEGVTAVVVYGTTDDDIRLSARSRDDRVHIGEALQHLIADIPNASAGGHSHMGGAKLPLLAFTDEDGERAAAPPDTLTDDIFAVLEGDI